MKPEPDLEGFLAGAAPSERQFVRDGCTYGEVLAMAAWLRDHFTAAEAQEVVGLATADKAVIAAALLATLAGGPILVLPHALSDQVLSELRTASGLHSVIVEPGRKLQAGLTGVVPQRVHSGAPLVLQRRPDEELCRLFTGGSTGAPRIWSKSCRNLFGEAWYHARHYGVGAGDLVLATVPPYHIYGLLFSVLMPLVAGAETAGDSPSFPAEIRQAAAEQDATILISVPIHYRALRGRALAGHSLRLAFSSAGMLEQQDNLDFFQRNGVAVTEVYGSTETGGIATRRLAQGESAFCPLEVVDWEEANNALLVRSPFISSSVDWEPDGYYSTGDQVRIVEGQGFLLLGRANSIVKIGGKRVDMEEVRAKIKEISGSGECVVFSRPTPGGRENELVALVEGEVEIPRLKRQLATVLEACALPRVIKAVAQIPVSANGKFDRAAIARMFGP